MATFDVVFSFQTGNAGWSEKLFVTAADATDAITKAEAIAPLRMELCGLRVDMPAIRASQVGINGDSLLSRKRFTTRTKQEAGVGWQFVQAVAQDNSDMPWTAAIVNLKASGLNRGRIYMRGLPDSLFEGNSGFSPGDVWGAAFDKWAAALKPGGWSVWVTPRPNVDDYRDVTGAIYTAGQRIEIVSADLNAVKGDRIYVGKVKLSGGTFGGFFKVFEKVTNNYKLDAYAKTTYTFEQGGYARIANKAFVIIDTASLGRGTSRRPGRPFGSPAGRRKKAHLCP